MFELVGSLESLREQQKYLTMNALLRELDVQ